MTNLLTHRAGGTAWSASSLLSSAQIQMDGMLQGFSEGASDWRSLTAMTLGGLAYRATKLGIVSVGAYGHTPLLARLSAPVLGLASEVTVFRGVRGVLQYAPTNSWSTDFVNFASLKIFALASRNTNLILSHTLQDVGMVAGHQLAYGLNLATRPKGTLFEQLAHAEMTNLQMQAGMGFGALLTGSRLQVLEKRWELASISLGIRSSLFQFQSNPVYNMASVRTRDHESSLFQRFHIASNGEKYPFSIVLHPLVESLEYQVLGTRSIAGRNFVLEVQIKDAGIVGQNFSVPAGSRHFILSLRENSSHGNVRLYVTPRALVVHTIVTKDLQAGAGTMVLNWLASMAAKQQLEFHVIQIENPLVMEILTRQTIIDLESARLEIGFYGFFNETADTGPFPNPHLLTRFPFRDYTNVRAKPHPSLLSDIPPL